MLKGVICSVLAIKVSAVSLRTKVEATLKSSYRRFDKIFAHDAEAQLLENFAANLNQYKNSSAFNAYSTVKGQPRCTSGTALSEAGSKALTVSGLSAFSGSTPIALASLDPLRQATKLFQQADGPAGAMVGAMGDLASASLTNVKGLLQTIGAIAATDIPPTVPPPVWNNMPFPCMPMLTGHNCAGSVAYPVTIGDFTMADASDSALDAVVANFPTVYRQRVGVTSDAQYSACFSAYMSMQCAATFPMCTTVQGFEDEIPSLGRAPMCFSHCVATLVACPGLWVDDISDVCSDVAVPPMCAMAAYNRAPPSQLLTFDEAHPYPLQCPGYTAN